MTSPPITPVSEKPTEEVLELPAQLIFPYPRQPYLVERCTLDLARLVESIERSGIAEPLIVRPREAGGYEIISGHRRDFCARLVGLDTRPAIVRPYTDEEADILVVDYNINREDLLPSEKARAYKLKLNAMKRQAGRPPKNGVQVGTHFLKGRSKNLLAQQVGESATQVQRYVALNRLIPALLDKVDSGRLKFVPAADCISRLTAAEQSYLNLVMERDEVSPSLGQARRLQELSTQGKLECGAIDAVMAAERTTERKVTLRNDRLSHYFPPDFTPRQVEDVIFQLLDSWQKKRKRELSR